MSRFIREIPDQYIGQPPGSLLMEYKKMENSNDTTKTSPIEIKGITGRISEVHVAVKASAEIAPLSSGTPTNDIDLKRMAQWAMNYLIQTPRKELNYEPVFQCHLYGCPPIPPGHDPVVPCDTDARINWEWYYMREVSGSSAGKETEAAFHRRLLGYVQEDGTVLAHPGAYNEGDGARVWKKEEYGYHIWGATKILFALSEDFRRTGDEKSKATARKIMLRLKRVMVYPSPDTCYSPVGGGMVKQDGTPVPNGWNVQPAPAVGSLVNYYLATGEAEALDFAKAYAEGIITGAQPDGIRFKPDGRFVGHGHVTMHALWGVAHLGLVTGDARYVEFVRRAWDFWLSQGTGTGWFPATGGHPGDETCCLSDMMSCAAVIARAGYPEYFDYTERYLRNIISNRQFVMTPAFEAEYRRQNAGRCEEDIRNGLETLKKFQGAVAAYSGLNDWENDLLGMIYWELAGCCAPEGMRAIYTTWSNVIDRLEASQLGPAGVYVNLCFSRESKWGRVVSFFPEVNRLTVQSGVKDTFFLRPPHWAPRDAIRAFVGVKSAPVKWSGGHVQFDNVAPGDELTITYPLVRFTHEVSGIWPARPNLKVTYQWLGNMITDVNPPPTRTPLFLGHPRLLPMPPPSHEEWAETPALAIR